MHCPRCTSLNWNHPLMVTCKVLFGLVVCTAIGLCVYLNINRDEYSGSKVKPLPGDQSLFGVPRNSPASEAGEDLSFSHR
jgi:hypothetical protein